MKNDYVSVVITTYNRREFLPIAIESVLNQSYKNLDIIVVNDHGISVQDIVESYHDPRIRYFENEKNVGLGLSRNVGIKNALGCWINFLDDDDFFYEHHIECLVSNLKKTGNKIAYTDAVCAVMQKDNNDKYQVVNRVIPYSFDYSEDMLLYQNITPVLCVMYELDDITRNILFGDRRCYEDWVQWLEITKHYPMNHIAIPTCCYTFRNDGSTMSSSRSEFTTLLPGIFAENWPRAKNQYEVAMAMNNILKQRGLSPMFQFTNA